MNFRALLAEETVTISGDTLVAVISGKVAGNRNVLKIEAKTVRDEAGNVVFKEYRSDPI